MESNMHAFLLLCIIDLASNLFSFSVTSPENVTGKS